MTTSSQFDHEAAAQSLADAERMTNTESRLRVFDSVQAGSLLDIAVSLRKLTEAREPADSGEADRG